MPILIHETLEAEPNFPKNHTDMNTNQRKRLLEAIGQGGEFALRNLGRPELPVQSTKHRKTKHKHLNPTSQDPDTILRNHVAECKVVVRCLPPSCWWTPRRLPLRLRPRQPPPLRQATQRNDQNAQSPPANGTHTAMEQSNQEPAAAARREANHRRVATGDASGEPLQRQAKAGRRAALLAGSGRVRRGNRERDGTTESSIGRAGGGGGAGLRKFRYFPARFVRIWCSWPLHFLPSWDCR
jgi:hypothetical protein